MKNETKTKVENFLIERAADLGFVARYDRQEIAVSLTTFARMLDEIMGGISWRADAARREKTAARIAEQFESLKEGIAADLRDSAEEVASQFDALAHGAEKAGAAFADDCEERRRYQERAVAFAHAAAFVRVRGSVRRKVGSTGE